MDSDPAAVTYVEVRCCCCTFFLNGSLCQPVKDAAHLWLPDLPCPEPRKEEAVVWGGAGCQGAGGKVAAERGRGAKDGGTIIASGT